MPLRSVAECPWTGMKFDRCFPSSKVHLWDVCLADLVNVGRGCWHRHIMVSMPAHAELSERAASSGKLAAPQSQSAGVFRIEVSVSLDHEIDQ